MPDLLWNIFDDACRAVRQEDRSEGEEYQRSLQQNPQNADAYLKLAARYKDADQYAEALSVLRDGLERCPLEAALYRKYIFYLIECNRIEEAIRVANQGLLVLPEAEHGAMRIAKRLALPVLYDTPEEVDRCRQDFQTELDVFCREMPLDTAAARASALEAIRFWVNFYLAYQGRNDRALNYQYGCLLQRVMAANYPQWIGPVDMPPLPPDGKLRVGYVSAHFRDHSVMKTHLGWLQEQDKSKIDVYSYYVGEQVDSTTEEVKRHSTRFSHTPLHLRAACEAIVRDRLHILVYLDIGMNPITGLMGALRLAPVQCVTWGHPMTSGLDTINYYISSSLMEPDDAQEHYCERLVRLPGVGVWFRKPLIPRVLLRKKRADFGLRDDAIVYLSSQAMSKYLPEQDYLFAQIAARLPGAQFVFMASNELVAADYQRRLGRAFSSMGLNAGRHCTLLPRMSLFNYWNLSLLCDAFLDTIGWSGGITTFEAIACDLPVVTMPGTLMRGRQSYGILTQLGVTETIAPDQASYVEIAVRLGSDGEWRKSVVARMRERSPHLYGDRTCVRALEAFYERAVGERLR